MKTILIPCLLGLAALQAQAAITMSTPINTVAYNGSTPSNTDLLQTSLSSAVLGGTYSPIAAGFGTPDSTVLRDGSSGANTIAATGYSQSVCENSAQNPQYTVTFNLDLTGAANGYDLTSIASFSGWSDNRVDQVYNIFYSTTADGNFTQLLSGTTVNGVAGAFGYTAAGSGGLKVEIIDTTGTIASNVDAIRFEILSVGGGTNYRELDVIGVASVPEPSAALLGGLGMLALLRRRR